MQGDGCFLFTEITCFFFTCSFYFHIDGFLSITIYKSTERKELSSCSVEQVQDVLAPVLDSDHIINLTLNRAIQGTFATWVKVQKGLRSSRSIEIITLFSPSGLEVTDFLNFWSPWHSSEVVVDCPCSSSRISWGPFPCAVWVALGLHLITDPWVMETGSTLEEPKGYEHPHPFLCFPLLCTGRNRSKMELTVLLKLSISSYQTTPGSAWVLPTLWFGISVLKGLRGNVCSLFYPFPQNMLPWWCREETYKSKPAAGSLRDA